MPCVPNPCSNGGECMEYGETGYRCNCVAGFTGGNCEDGEDFFFNLLFLLVTATLLLHYYPYVYLPLLYVA